MAITLAAAARTAEANAVGDSLNSGFVRIYQSTGTPPDPDATTGLGTLLAQLTFGADAFAAATDDGTNASAVAAAITDDSSADATGTADYFRATTSGGVVWFQGNVTSTGGGGDMELNTTSIVAGGTVSISSFTYRKTQA